MSYGHFTQFYDNFQTTQTLDQITPYMSGPLKVGPEDFEIDLTAKSLIPLVKHQIEEVVTNYYSKKVTCLNYWIAMSRPGEPVVNHNHVSSDNLALYSAVLYLQADSNCGTLKLEDFDVDLAIAAGDLVIFPASCYHSVSSNNSQQPRICVAFDLFDSTKPTC